MFIDAFGWELLRRVPFLDDVLVHKQPLQSIFGYSSTCDPTILTGLMPRDHGHFSFFYYAPDHSPFKWMKPLKILPQNLTSRGRVRHWISRLMKKLYGYTGYFQIYNMPFERIGEFDYSEKRDIYEKGGINSGAPTIFDVLRDQRVPFHLSDWRADEQTNLDSLEKTLRKGKIRFAYLYLAGMDALLHSEGTGSPLVRKKIAWYEEKLQALLKVAHSNFRSVALYVFSDHGMTDITDTCDLKQRIKATGLTYGTDYAAVFDSTMARFWFLQPSAREKIEEALSQEKKGRILTEADLMSFGCDFPDHKYGEMFFLLNPGILLCPSDMGDKPLAGMHGYHPLDPHTYAMFATTERLERLPNTLADLHAVMMNELGISAETR